MVNRVGMLVASIAVVLFGFQTMLWNHPGFPMYPEILPLWQLLGLGAGLGLMALYRSQLKIYPTALLWVPLLIFEVVIGVAILRMQSGTAEGGQLELITSLAFLLPTIHVSSLYCLAQIAASGKR